MLRSGLSEMSSLSMKSCGLRRSRTLAANSSLFGRTSLLTAHCRFFSCLALANEIRNADSTKKTK